MNSNVSLLRRAYRVAALLAVLPCFVLLIGCPANQSGSGGATTAGSKDYPEVTRLFSVGLLAMQVGIEDVRAEEEFKRAAQLAPDEPAILANLGLVQLRQNKLEEAATHIAKAQSLAPDNSEIAVIAGVLAGRKGNYDEAVASFKRAVEQDPKNLRALWLLAEEVQRRGGPDADAEYDRLIQQIVQIQPRNLYALAFAARNAARRGDAAALKAAVAAIAAQSAGWPPDIRQRLADLQTASNAPDVRQAAPKALYLSNVLKTRPEYRQAMAQLGIGSNTSGAEPLLDFVKLPKLNRTPAPPDTELTYTISASNSESGKNQRAVYLTGEGNPVVRSSSRGDTVLPLDYNNDFKTDIAYAGSQGFRLERQEGSGSFTDVTAKLGLPNTVLKAKYTGAWSADIEMDGDLDILLATASGRSPVVLQNNGDGTFRQISVFGRDIKGMKDFVWADIDADGDPDAIIVGADALFVFTNERSGQFLARETPPDIGVPSAITAADANNDGVMDIVMLRKEGTVVRLSDRNQGAGWDTGELIKVSEADALFVADMDNNGGLDVITSGKKGTQIALSDQKGAFSGTPLSIAVETQDIADFNGDGTLDLICRSVNDNKPAVAVGKGTKGYHYLALRPRAAKKAGGDDRINTFGIGGEMDVRSGLLAQKQVITAPVVHFGLGDSYSADLVRIVWPNGSVRGEFALKADTVLVADQRLLGSCPFLFTWNGSKMEFVTDCIWRSPLGLRINAQDTAGVAMTEDWVKIRGDQLVPREDGTYDLRITAELWETHFFDHLALMTVDHPEDTDIFVDERFSIPPPPLRVITTATPKPIAKATADTGQDLTALVAERDDQYTDFFGRGKYQGVTRDHYIEIDLGQEAKERKPGVPLYLIAHGWIHPTDTSINVALSQGKHAPPSGLRLETLTEQGEWKLAKPGLGFPTGKVKTVVIRLDDVLPRNTTRCRLRTNLEIFWDQIRWTSGEATPRIKTQRLMPRVATLRYRGFSDVRAKDASSPELPQDYDRLIGTGQKWRDLIGYYTRFGDVRELLARVDDRYIIMNAGDEIQLRFTAPPPPPAGWKRDFVLIGDGWVKDGNYNTTFSKTVLPLPTHANPDYTTPPGNLEDDPVYRQHRKDWEIYHTRYVTPDAFQYALRP